MAGQKRISNFQNCSRNKTKATNRCRKIYRRKVMRISSQKGLNFSSMRGRIILRMPLVPLAPWSRRAYPFHRPRPPPVHRRDARMPKPTPMKTSPTPPPMPRMMGQTIPMRHSGKIQSELEHLRKKRITEEMQTKVLQALHYVHVYMAQRCDLEVA